MQILIIVNALLHLNINFVIFSNIIKPIVHVYLGSGNVNVLIPTFLQVNTEPSSSKTFTLEVVEKPREVEEEDEEENSMAKVQNDQKTSDESDSSVQSLSIVSVRLGVGGREENRFHFSKVELGEEEKAGELEEEEEDSEGDGSSPPVAVSPVHTPSSPSLGPWGSSLGPPSLAAPVLSLLSLTLLVIGLGALRGFYVR